MLNVTCTLNDYARSKVGENARVAKDAGTLKNYNHEVKPVQFMLSSRAIYKLYAVAVPKQRKIRRSYAIRT